MKIRIGQTTVLKFARFDAVEEAAQRQLLESALRDGLTRAFNRRYFVQRLGAEIRFAERHGQPLALLMLDIDQFKKVNDSHGHMIGDDVLRAVVGVLSDTLRAEDVLARYGGEEFAVLVRGVSAENARLLGERLRREVEEMALSKETGEALPVTISVGISTFPLAEAGEAPAEKTGEKLIELADAALYRAKKAGRNRVEM